MTLEQMQKEGRGIIEKYNDWIHDKAEAPQDKDFSKWLDQHTANTWKAALDTILESGLLEDKKKNSVEHFSGNGYFNQQGHNQAVKAIREFITKIK